MKEIYFLLLVSLIFTTNPFTSESQFPGYVPIRGNLQMFYWLFKHREINVPEAPIILWLQGGPGCSDVANALGDLGPYELQKNNTLKSNPYAWNTYADVLFVDQPLCVGFSFCDKISDNSPLYEDKISEDLYTFYKGFLSSFPEYKQRRLYIAGHSYGGHYVPSFAKYLLTKNDPDIVLSGIAIGNGWINHKYQAVKNVEFVEKHRKLTMMQKLSAQCSFTLSNIYSSLGWSKLAQRHWRMGDAILTRINPEFCIYDYSKPGDCLSEETTLMTNYVNTKDIYDSLGIQSTKKWNDCNNDIFAAMYKDEMADTSGELIYVLNAGIKTILYQGSKDVICNNDGVENLLNNLEWSGLDKFKATSYMPYFVMGVEKGVMKSYGPLTYITDNYSGHMIVMDDKEASFDIVQRLIG